MPGTQEGDSIRIAASRVSPLTSHDRAKAQTARVSSQNIQSGNGPAHWLSMSINLIAAMAITAAKIVRPEAM